MHVPIHTCLVGIAGRKERDRGGLECQNTEPYGYEPTLDAT